MAKKKTFTQNEITELLGSIGANPRYKRSYMDQGEYNRAYDEWMSDDSADAWDKPEMDQGVDYSYYSGSLWGKVRDAAGINNLNSENDLSSMYNFVRNYNVTPQKGTDGKQPGKGKKTAKGYKPKPLKIKTPKKNIPKPKTIKGLRNNKDIKKAESKYLTQIKDLKTKLAKQTKSSSTASDAFKDSIKDLKAQMGKSMAGYQSLLANQAKGFQTQFAKQAASFNEKFSSAQTGFQTSLNTQAKGFSDQLAARDEQYATQLGKVNTANEQRMRTMAQQMSPTTGGQVMGIQGSVDPGKRLQMRRAGVSGQAGRQGLRLKSLNL